jgi:uncharacterized protein (DUF302 family)
LFASAGSAASVSQADKYGVYVKIIEKAKGSVDEVSKKVEGALKNSGWEILGTYDSAIPEDCKFSSRVITFTSPAYSKSIMAYGVKAAFALPLRVGIYDDETGVNVVVLNPASINRTIVHETKLNDFSLSALNSISTAITKAVPGGIALKQMGEMRSKGSVEGMWGGDFLDKIVTIYASRNLSDDNFKRIVENVKYGILHNRENWKLVYTLDLSAHNAVIFGVTQEKMEAMAFKTAREKGGKLYKQGVVLYHDTAFPIELIIYKDGGKIKVVTLDEMYRMKLYFQDAGTWLFIKHMRKPGEIQEEIVEIALDGIMKDTGQ